MDSNDERPDGKFHEGFYDAEERPHIAREEAEKPDGPYAHVSHEDLQLMELSLPPDLTRDTRESEAYRFRKDHFERPAEETPSMKRARLRTSQNPNH